MPAEASSAGSDPAKTDRRLFRIGAIGAGITALCCVTPVLVVVFTALGVGAAIGYLDLVLFPLLAGFLLLTVLAWVRMRRRRAHAAPGNSS